MPFGPYADFDECVLKNSDKSTPEAFCAWLHHKILGTWPSGMTADKYPEPFLTAYDAALVAQKAEAEAFKEGTAAAEEAGYELTRFGWIKQFQAPNMKKITGVKIFATGEWTDSAGVTRNWTNEDLDKMVDAFTAGVPAVVPLKCGHTSDGFNRRIAEALEVPVELITGEQGQGQISLGKMISQERKGSLLIAGFDKIPEPIANLIEGGQYSTVSVEIEDAVGDYGPVVTGVALLGVEEPAVDDATLERALVFGGKREGARVLTFTVGDDLPISQLRAEFEEIRGKLAEIIKGKRGAPLFRAMFGNLNTLFEQLVGKMNQSKGGKMKTDFHTVHERLRYLAQDLGLPEGASLEDVIAELQRLQAEEGEIPEEVRALADQEYQGDVGPLIAWAGRVGFDQCVVSLTGKPGITDPTKVCGWLKGQAHSKSNEGGNNLMKLPKSLEGKKPEEIRAMSLPDLLKLFDEGEAPKVEDLKAVFQEGDVAAIAAALGLAEGATVEDIVAAIQALVEKAKAGPENEGGEMKTELSKAGTRIAVLEAEKAVRDWEDQTREFNAIPGTARENAVKLADIESKAGKEAAKTQYEALKEANRLSEEALKIAGTSRTAGPTDFDNEVVKYMKDHADVSKVDAIKAVSKERPDLYFARRERQ